MMFSWHGDWHLLHDAEQYDRQKYYIMRKLSLDKKQGPPDGSPAP
jgi:hypothetical protein